MRHVPSDTEELILDTLEREEPTFYRECGIAWDSLPDDEKEHVRLEEQTTAICDIVRGRQGKVQQLKSEIKQVKEDTTRCDQELKLFKTSLREFCKWS